MSDFRSADAEGKGAECAMRAGMTVSADDGHAGLGAAEFRADDVYDTAARVAHAEQFDTELGGVALELTHLLSGRIDLDRHIAEDLFTAGGRRMVHGRQRSVGTPHGQAQRLQDAECLRRRDLVDEMQIDVENGRRIGRLRHHFVCGPDLVE